MSELVPTNPMIPGNYWGVNSDAPTGVGISEQIGAFIGQKLTSGTAVVGTVYEITGTDMAATLFGAGSWLHRMFIDTFTINPYARYVAVCGADDGTKASKSYTFTGSASGEVVINLTVAGDLFTVQCADGSSAASVVSKIVSELGIADNSYAAVTASASTGTLTLTAKNGGAEGNSIYTAMTITGKGITVSGGGHFTGGVDGAFDVDVCLDALATHHYAVIAFPYTSEARITKLKSYLDFVSGPVEKRAATAYCAYLGTVSSAITLRETIDYNRISIASAKSSLTPSPQIAAAIATAVLSQPDPALPFDHDPLATVQLPVSRADELTTTEKMLMLKSGITPLESLSKSNMGIVRLVSTATTGYSRKNPDMWIRSTDYVRESASSEVDRAFHKSKLLEKTASSVRAFLLGHAIQLAELGIVRNVEEWKDRFIVTESADASGFLIVKYPIDIVKGMHGTIGWIELVA